MALEDIGPNKRSQHIWRCVCDCGNEFRTRACRLTSGERTDCGCIGRKRKIAKISKHGMTGTPEFKSWEGAKRRCRNPHDKNYANYGGRGIKFSEKWNDFANFYRDMGAKPGADYSLDRIDTNGNYEPDNCRWATQRVQQNNRRNNVKVRVNGVELSLFVYFGRIRSSAWQRAAYRLKQGWSMADAIFQPAHAGFLTAAPNAKMLGLAHDLLRR
ncbi:hypothetical protein KVP10_08585 [Candidimonas humi]|uniref:AP2 domain-containing protein n=1 Tax=Candidimonas humi TaxID=683355 RepID=A0ABV8NUN8_9BURK|nr:hypothetical protein [Candidimonas humi]MBV6304943.1 hypothetical protein [Candidimonas humi]